MPVQQDTLASDIARNATADVKRVSQRPGSEYVSTPALSATTELPDSRRCEQVGSVWRCCSPIQVSAAPVDESSLRRLDEGQPRAELIPLLSLSNLRIHDNGTVEQCPRAGCEVLS